MKKILCAVLVLVYGVTLFGCAMFDDKVTIYLPLEQIEKHITPHQTGPNTFEEFVREKVVYQYQYDENGIVTQITDHSSGEFNGVSSVECDGNGLILHRTVRDEKGKIIRDYRYTYDENGNMLTEDVQNNLRTVRVTKWAYDEKGRILTETTAYDPYVTGSVYTYDDQKGIHTYSRYTNGECVEYNETILDGSGNPVSVTRNQNGELYERSEYTYSGNTVSISHYDNTGHIYTLVRTKNEKGLVTQEEEIKASGEEASTTTFEYDEHGNLIKREIRMPFQSSSENDDSQYANRTTTYTYFAVKVPKDSLMAKLYG